MMSRPIFTKKIKRNKVVYNLELWSPANDNFLDIHEPPNFRKDFFIDSDPSSSWPESARNQERFDKWFDSLPEDKQKLYAKAIDESNRVIICMVWDLIDKQDKNELFNNNIRSFSNWFSRLEPTDVDFYMTRIIGKQGLMPSEVDIDSEVITEKELASILEGVYDRIDDDLIRATSINGLLCISCSNELRLQKAKQHLIKHGSILRDYRKKQNSSGRVIYTYIFSKP